jgi:hypothetical protein
VAVSLSSSVAVTSDLSLHGCRHFCHCLIDFGNSCFHDQNICPHFSVLRPLVINRGSISQSVLQGRFQVGINVTT